MNQTKRLARLSSILILLLFFVGSVFAQQRTWYVDNQIGNDGRNGLSATIPSPDDGVTGPKRTLGGAQGAIAESNAGDIIIVKNTGVQYAAATGEPATISVTKQLYFRSTDGMVDIGRLFDINNAVAAPANTVIFDSGEFKFSSGLKLTVGVLTNTSELITVGTSVQRVVAAAVVNGQLKYTGTVNFTYDATMTTADEFPVDGTFGAVTVSAGNLTLKTTAATMTGVFNTAGTLDLGANVLNVSNTGNVTQTFGGNVTNGTLAFSMTAGTTVTQAGAFALPTITATTKTAATATLALGAATAVTGSLTANGNADITTNGALVTYGTPGNTSDVIINNGVGDITVQAATIHGNVLLSSAVTAATKAQIIFAGANTINGSVTNNASLTVSNAATWNGAVSGRIIFPNAAQTITGNLVNSSTIAGAYGTTTDVDGFGNITLANIATNVTINGAIINSAKTTLSGTANPADFSGNGLITWGNAITTGIIRADGGIQNTSDFSGIAAANNTNNAQVVIGGAARTGISTVGTSANRVGAIVNSSKGHAAAGGNGAITIGVGDGTSGGFFGSSVEVSGTAVGGVTTFGGENFNVSGSVVNARDHASASLVIGTAAVALRTVTIAGNLESSAKATTNVNITSTGAVAITGALKSSGTGTIDFANLTTGSFTAGGLTMSGGTVDVNTGTHNGTLTFNGLFDISGGALDVAAGAAQTFVITGNVSLTGGTITSGNRAAMVMNSAAITIGGTTTNPTLTATTVPTIGNPTPAQLVNVTIGSFNPVLPGSFVVNNTIGLAEAVRFTGGTMTVTDDLTFTSGKVNITNQANITVIDDFLNTAGYTTSEQGRITLDGGAAQAFGGAGSFGTIEFKSASPATSSTVTLTGFVYLTAGTVGNGGGAITISNATTYPTIVRNAGTFGAAPTFGSMVNVTYIGDDKATGNELPAAADKLNNLTVATTTGVSGTETTAQRGAVKITTTTVNGTLTVNDKQALVIQTGQKLSLNGDNVVLTGDIASIGTGVLEFAKTTGTTITGAGFLPPLEVKATSTGNVIDGATAIIDEYLGTDGEFDDATPVGGGALDHDVAVAAADGSLTFGAGVAGLTFKSLGTGSGPAVNSHIGAITTVNAGNDLDIDTDLVQAGLLTHAAGTITVAAEKTLNYLNTAMTYDKVAVLNGDGTLLINQDTDSDVTVTVSTDDATIDIAEVVLDLDGPTPGTDDFNVTTNDLTFTGNVTITDGGLELTTNVTLTGKKFTVAAAGSTAGAGILTLKPTTANSPLQWSFEGTPTITNVTLNGDVDLVGGGTALSVGTLVHTTGALNFGTRNLTVTTAFDRAAGTYTGTGYFIWNSGTATNFDQGDAFAINNIHFLQSATAENFAWTVNDNIGLDNGATVTATGVLSLGVADENIPVVTINGTGDFAVSPTLAQGKVDLTYAKLGTWGAAEVASTVGTATKYWPTTAFVNTVTVNRAAANVALNDNRTISGKSTLVLADGTLTINATKTLTLVDSLLIKRSSDGVLTATGTLSAPFVNLEYYKITGGAAGAIVPGDEYTDPTVVNNVVVNHPVTVGAARTIAGMLDVNATTTINANTTIAGVIDVATGTTLVIDNNAAAPTYTLTTTNNVTFNGTATMTGSNGNFIFAGATGQTITAPAAGATIPNVTVNMTGVKPVLNINAGNLTVGNLVTFVNGIINVEKELILPNPTAAGNSGLGFDRSGVTGTNVGHVVGTVNRQANTNDGATNNGRFEFPTGSLEGEYRPAMITFTPSYPVGNPVQIKVSHADSRPTGIRDLPLDGGNDVSVGNYPDFHWNISTFPGNLTHTQNFDIQLDANNLGYKYDDYNDLRIIRRQNGDSESNGWMLQGTAAGYSNYQAITAADTAVSVGATSSIGGLVQQGSIFTIGMPVTAPKFTAPTVTDYTMNEGDTLTVQFTAQAQIAGGSVTYSLVDAPDFAEITTAGLVTFTPAVTKDSTTAYVIKVKATDNQGQETVKMVDLTVVHLNVAPKFTATIGSSTARYGQEFTFEYKATDDEGNDLTFMLASVTGDTTSADTAATLTAAGMFTWTPVQADSGKTVYLTVKVTDGMDTVMAMDTLEVSGNRAPVITAGIDKDTVYMNMGSYSVEFTATDADNDDVTFELMTPTAGAAITADGSFTWDLTEAGQGYYTIVVKATDAKGAYTTVTYNVVVVNNVGVTDIVPEEYYISQNYPNPFNPTTKIEFGIKTDSEVKVVVLNVLGQEVKTITDGNLAAGTYTFDFDASRLPSGMYIYRIKAVANDGSDQFVSTKKMMLVK